MKKYALSFIIIVGIIFLTACGKEIETNMSEEVGDFEFTTQDKEAFGLDDLKGGWWLANFMYTDCTIVCPRTTPNMASVQAEINEAGLDAQFVSFSVDPSHDTPDTLKNYAKDYPIDLDNWHFLTGYDFETIKVLSNHSFQTVLEGGGPDEHEFAHSTQFFLVNPEGKVVKKYDGMSVKAMDTIIEDMKTVL